MYCIHCGAVGAGKFCASCGQRQSSVGGESNPKNSAASVAVEPINADDALDWTETIDYERLLSLPHARQRIAAVSRGAGLSVTGEDVLEIFDAVSPIGFSLGKFTKAILPLYDKLGIKTDRQVQCTYETPPGRLMLAALCAIASHSLTIDEVHQAPNQCSLSIEIPLGFVTNRGRLSILIENCGSYCQITLTMIISGQWFDWGKSNRMMTNILAGIQADLTDQFQGQCPQWRRVA